MELDGKVYVPREGWDRVYVFGPHTWVQEMTEADMARLFASEANRRAYRDLTQPILLFPSGGDVRRFG
jgi:hypothetical protein